MKDMQKQLKQPVIREAVTKIHIPIQPHTISS